jgi:DNA-binding transcriptional LysR family regulator
MDLKAAQLRYFVNVAGSRSFKEAARRTFRSQPAVSLAVKALEVQLGASLFESGKRVSLTGVGATILPMVEEFLQHHDRLARLISQAAQGQAGDVSVAANPTVASRWMPTIIREYATRYPGVGVFVTDDNSEKVHDLVASGLVDLGVASIHSQRSEVDFTPVMSDQFGVLCRRDHPFGKTNKRLDWSMLRDMPIIGNITHRLLENLPVYRYLRKPHIFMSTLTSLLANVEGGVGVTVLPKLAVPDGHPRLIFKTLRRPHLARTVGILVRRGRTLAPQARIMHDLIVDRFKVGKAR